MFSPAYGHLRHLMLWPQGRRREGSRTTSARKAAGGQAQGPGTQLERGRVTGGGTCLPEAMGTFLVMRSLCG